MSGGRSLPLPERPCLVAFLLEMRRPSGVLGPLEREPLSAGGAVLGVGVVMGAVPMLEIVRGRLL